MKEGRVLSRRRWRRPWAFNEQTLHNSAGESRANKGGAELVTPYLMVDQHAALQGRGRQRTASQHARK